MVHRWKRTGRDCKNKAGDILITLEKQNVVTERDQLNMSLSRAQTSINELQTRYDNLNKSYSQLEDEKYRLEGKMAEKEELQTRYNNLRKIYRQLEDDRNHLKRMVESMESRVSYSGDLFGAFTHLSPF
ncbi:nuclear matrix constituent protein 1-like isoform X3 [Plectropomus leopardus]|uniref:nuclear matrix constituent protein 1-like isoform X3 n=1 Tax=Plectropomus leopardus TaxID=160734 RepID=UPI001C4D0CDB|nr:nuclear matrix constituent protein 1-like isoform X3 [Plectropomus leopardus]